MSAQTVRDFWQKAKEDAGLRKKLSAIQEKERQAVIAAIVKLAGEAGFGFTVQEYQTAVKEDLARQHGAAPLSEAELEKFAGGASPKTHSCLAMDFCA